MIQTCGAEGKDRRKALLSLRNTPVDQNLPSPSQLLQGRVLRDNIPVASTQYLVNGYDIEGIRMQLGERQSKQKYYFDRKSGAEKSPLEVGQTCHFKPARGKWIPGTVQGVDSARSYIISTSSGNTFRRNRMHVRSSQVVNPQGSLQVPRVPLSTPTVESTDSVHSGNITPREDPVVSGASPGRVGLEQTTSSGRRVRLPVRFSDYEM